MTNEKITDYEDAIRFIFQILRIDRPEELDEINKSQANFNSILTERNPCDSYWEWYLNYLCDQWNISITQLN